jgi:hypothetical protein
MKLSWNLLFQGLALIVQYGNQATSVVPPKYHSVLALAVGLAQAAVAWKAQHYEPRRNAGEYGLRQEVNECGRGNYWRLGSWCTGRICCCGR